MAGPVGLVPGLLTPVIFTHASCGLVTAANRRGALPRALLRCNRGRSAGRVEHPGAVRSTRRVAAPGSESAGFRFPPEVITLAVRWYLRFGLSHRDVEELLAERGVEVDHTTVLRWTIKTDGPHARS